MNNELQSEDSETDEVDGPGWMPAILAATALMAIVGFIVCAFSTWVLFQKRTELAVRTLRDSYLPEIEQSLLDPKTKAAVADQIKRLTDDMQRGEYENWQSAGIMQRLQRLPVLHWGDLQAVEAVISKQGDPETLDESRKQLSRLRRATEIGNATSFDFEDVLTPVYVSDPNASRGHRLIQPIEIGAAEQVVMRAKLIADREQVPDQMFADVRIESIVREQIEAGGAEGGF